LQKYENSFIQCFGPVTLNMPDEGHGTETLNKVILILLQILVCGTFLLFILYISMKHISIKELIQK